jgi:hypothetical protein
MDGAELRAVLLQIIDELSKQYVLQPGAVLQRAVTKLGIQKQDDE